MSEAPSKKELVFILLSIGFLAVVLLFMINLRESQGYEIYPNGESYYHLRIARDIAQDPFLEEDSVQETSYYPTAYHYMLAFLMLLTSESFTAYYAPVLFGIAFAVLFMWLLTALGFSRNNAATATFLLIVTPAFLVSFSTLSQAGFTAMLSLIVISLYFEKNYWDAPWKASGKIFFSISIFFLMILAITSLVGFAITLALMAVLSVFHNRNISTTLFAATPSFLLFIPLSIFTDYLSMEWRSMGFHLFSFREVFTIFGSELGLGFFLLLLYFTGLVIMWGWIRHLRPFHIFSLLLVAVSLFNPLLRVYSSLVILVYAVIAIKHLYYTRWELEVAKTGTVILLVCALVFSSLSQVTAIVKAEPGPGAVQALDRLSALPPGIVFSSPEYGFIIQEHSKKKTLIDDNSRFGVDYQIRLLQYNSLLNTSRLKDAEPLLNATGITYFLITPDMKERIWHGKEKDLLLLLKNSARFDLVNANEEGFEVWKLIDSAD